MVSQAKAPYKPNNASPDPTRTQSNWTEGQRDEPRNESGDAHCRVCAHSISESGQTLTRPSRARGTDLTGTASHRETGEEQRR